MKKIVATILVVLLKLFLYSAVVDRVIVKVNNENILKSEYDKLFATAKEQFEQLLPKEEQTPEKIKELKQKVLNQLIEDKLLLQEAKRQKIKVTKREIEEGIKTVKLRFPSDEAFRLELRKENLTEKQFEERITNQIMVLKLIDENVRKKVPQPTEEQAKKVFDKIMRYINTGNENELSKEEREDIKLLAHLVKRYFSEQVRVRHILVRVTDKMTKEKALKRIEEIKQKLLLGEDFAELAKKYSDDASSQNGGDLGFIARGDTVEEFEKVAFALQEGQVSDIVETRFGFHIIKVIEKRKKRTPNFEEIKQDLLQYVYRKTSEEYYEKYVSTLKKNANIQYLVPIE